MDSSLPVAPLRRLAAFSLISSLLFAVFLGFATPQSALGRNKEARRTTVIVELEQPPLAAVIREGGGQKSPRRGGPKTLEVESPEAQERLSRISIEHNRLAQILSQDIPAATIARRYRITFNGLAVAVPVSAIVKLKRIPGVKRVSPTRNFHPTLDASVPVVNAPAVWNNPGIGGVSQAGLGQKIAILDTGIDQTQPFLTDGSLSPPSGFPKGEAAYTTEKVIVAKVYAPVGVTNTLTISNVHGTHVSGIAAGIPNYNTGSRVITGVAPKAFLMNYKVFYTDAIGNTVAETAEIIQAIEHAVADGADVVNMSFGGYPDPVSDAPLFQAIRNGTQAGVVFVAAAGNGYSPGTILSPGTSPDVITVGASNNSDSLAGFSSRGPNPDLSIKPDATAPGVSVFSSLSGGSFGTLSGTSMSTPHVAGAAALLKQLHPAWTAAQIKSALVNTAALPIYDPYPTAATVMERGGGRIDLQQAQDPGVTLSPVSHSFTGLNVAPSGNTASNTFSMTDVSGSGGTWTISAVQVITGAGLQVSTSTPSITVPAGGTVTFNLVVSGAPGLAPGDYEGYVALQSGSNVLHVPYFLRTVNLPHLVRFPLLLNHAELQ